MAVMEKDVKLVQTVKLSGSPSRPGALSWSQDDRIAVVTDQCVYILSLLCPKNIYSSEMYIEQSTVPWHEKPIHLDVEINEVKKSDGIGFERTDYLFHYPLNPMVCGSVKSNNFHSVSWSPSGMDFNYRCILATLSEDHQVFIHISSKLSRKWKRTISITKYLQDYLHKCAFHVDFDDVSSISSDSSQTEINDKKTIHKFSEFKRRLNFLSVTSLQWHPTLFENTMDIANSVNDFNSFAILTTGNKSGYIMFWKISAPVLNEKTSVEMVGIINCDSSSLCALAWFHSDDQQATFLAAGDSNGLVYLFAVDICQSSGVVKVRSKAKYVVWGDRDEMAVNYLHWFYQKENGSLHLLATKGTTVIVFNIIIVSGKLLEMPQHYFVNSFHTIAISGLSCSQNGLVTTCATNGTVQSFLLGANTSSAAMLLDRKENYMCNGIVVSPNGMFIAVFYSPASILQQNSNNFQVQIRILSIVTEEKVFKVLSAVKSSPVDIHLPWDVMEACRQLSAQGNASLLYKELDETSNSVPCMYLKLFLERFLAGSRLARSNETDVVYNLQHDASRDRIIKHLVMSRLKEWKDSIEEVKLPSLLMCDWLVFTFPEEQVMDFVASIYERLGEEKVAKATRSMTQRLPCKAQTNHIHNDHTMTDIQPEGMNTELEKIPQTKQANNGLQPFVSLNNVIPAENSDANFVNQQTAEVNESANIVKITGNQKGLNSDAAPEMNCTVICAPKCFEEPFTPVREVCAICGSAVPLSRENPMTGTCENEHSWQRCCVTFLLCSDYEYRRCQTCNHCVRLQTNDLSPQLQEALGKVRNCPFCAGWFG